MLIVSTVQCELFYFSGGHFADPMMSRLCYRRHQLGDWDLKLLQLLARHFVAIALLLVALAIHSKQFLMYTVFLDLSQPSLTTPPPTLLPSSHCAGPAKIL